MKKIALSKKIATTLAFFTSFLFSDLTAQTITPATVNDIVRKPCRVCGISPSSVQVLNADMLELDGIYAGHNLYVIAWGGATGIPVPNGFWITSTVPGAGEDFGNLGFSLPSPISNPDIVLASYDLGGVITYKIVATYESAGDIYIETMNISPNLAQHKIATFDKTIKITSSGKAHNPHIDLMADNGPSFSSTTPPMLHNAVVVWDEEDPLGNKGVYATTTDIVTLSSLTTFTIQQIATDGITPDVAAVAENISYPSIVGNAFITYTNAAATSLSVTQWDINSTSLYTTVVEPSATNIVAPRIEGMTLARFVPTPTPPVWTTRWHAVASVEEIGATNISVKDYTESWVMMPNTINPISNFLNTTDDYLMPVVCGTGEIVPGGPSNVGRASYPIAFYGDYNFGSRNENIYACYVDAVFPAFPGSQFYEVSKTPLTTPFTLSNKPAIAIATCSNTGKDVFTTWYNGTDIMVKLNANVQQFKPTEVKSVTLPELKLTPNPVSNTLKVSGGNDFHYTIVNLLGQNILEGRITDESIDVSHLITGEYLITLTNEDKFKTQLKFIKY